MPLPPALTVLDVSPEGNAFSLELPDLPPHLAEPGATWTLQRVFFRDSDKHGGPKRVENQARELLAEHLAPGSQYVLEIPLDGQRWEIRAIATIGDERVLSETSSLHLYGLNILSQPNPGRRVMKGTPPGPLTFCCFAPCGFNGEPGLRAVIMYASSRGDTGEFLVQRSTDGIAFELIETTRYNRRLGGTGWCTVPVESGGTYWLRAFERSRDTETPSEDVLQIKVP